MPLHVSSTMCSSSGGQNCIIQHLVSSHTVGGRPAPTGCDDTRCCIIQSRPPDDEHIVLETYRGISFIVCPCNMINIFIITNTMHTIGVDKITLFKTT